MQRELGILLVEDDSVDVMNMKRALKKNALNHKLYVSKNGMDALDFLRGSEKPSPFPSVILLDLNMPKMGGLEFLRELRKDASLKALPVIILTTSGQPRDVTEAYNLNAAGYIIKPLSFDQFVYTVSTLNQFWNLIEHAHND